MKLARMISPLILLAGTSALAQTPGDIALGTPAYGGNGCPAGSAAATLSPDGKSLSILFDNYIVQAGGTSGNTVDRKSCNIAIPVTVPAGYSVSVFKIDYRGFNSLPQGASSEFNVEYFFAGSQGPRFQKAFSGPVNDDFIISNEVVAQTVSWSPCGEDVNLRANTSLMAQTNSAYQQTMATVDSADINAAVVFQLAWRTCGSGPVNPGPGPGPINPNPQPQPINTCSIAQGRNAYGQTLYRVMNRSGAVLYTTTNYQDAIRAQQTTPACFR